MMKSLSLTALLLSATLLGCQDESAPGGPGVTDGKTVAEDETFVVQVPSTSVDIKQGEDQEITVTIDRGENFKQMVTLEFTAPAGLTVTPKTIEIQPAETEAKVTVAADASATAGDSTITVNATPETGAAVSHEIKVSVNAAEGTATGTQQPQTQQPQSEQSQSQPQTQTQDQQGGTANQQDSSAPPANPGEAPQP